MTSTNSSRSDNQSTPDDLFDPQAHFLHIVDHNSGEFDGLRLRLAQQYPDNTVRGVRGDKAVTKEAFFEHMGAAFQFPSYFGENWDAFMDVMRDVPGEVNKPHLLMINSASDFLSQASDRDFSNFLDVMKQLDKELAAAGENGGTALSFKVLLGESGSGMDKLKRMLGNNWADFKELQPGSN